MEKTQKRIIPKKLLVVVPLCLMLFAISVVFNTANEEETPQPFFQNGIWFDPLIPEIMIPALNYSTEPVSLASVTYPLPTPNLHDGQGDGIITRYVLLALDDNFLSCSYETPEGILGAWEYARKRTWVAFNYFYSFFKIRFQICGEVTWQSDSSNAEAMFYEAIQEIGFYVGKCYNGYPADVLIAWTTQFRDFAGLGSRELATAMIDYQVYWADDNVAQHEMSHVFNATDGTEEAYMNGIDCYYEECVMSYRLKYVSTWWEGKTYSVYAEIRQAFLTHLYCEYCSKKISRCLWSYYSYLWNIDKYGGWDC